MLRAVCICSAQLTHPWLVADGGAAAAAAAVCLSVGENTAWNEPALLRHMGEAAHFPLSPHISLFLFLRRRPTPPRTPHVIRTFAVTFLFLSGAHQFTTEKWRTTLHKLSHHSKKPLLRLLLLPRSIVVLVPDPTGGGRALPIA